MKAVYSVVCATRSYLENASVVKGNSTAGATMKSKWVIVLS